jgi:hypothetical protein
MFSQPGQGDGSVATVTRPALDLTPTDQQAAIIDAAQTGTDLVITAGAGTGKTSTLKMLARPNSVYIAYNRAIKDDAAASFPAGVHCTTAHSLAYRAIVASSQGLQDRLRNSGRQPARETARLLGLPLVVSVGQVNLTGINVARLVSDTVARFCRSTSSFPSRHHIPDVPGLDTPAAVEDLAEVVLPAAQRMWDDITSPHGQMRFTHDHYLKMWALTDPRLPYSRIMLDEAQDADPLIASIVQSQPGQKIMVGDSAQAIYGWRGAIDAMETFQGDRYALTQSWRFGTLIAREANRWLAMLDTPLRLTGNPGRDSQLARLGAADAVLCRTNAGALAQVMAAQSAGRPVALVGGGQDILRLAEAARDLQSGRGTSHPEFMAFHSWREVLDYAENDSGGSDLKTLVKLIKAHGTEKIIRAIHSLVDEHTAEIIISTAHKAKGREWARVRIADDFAPPYDKDGQLLTDEVMLTYVAVTRAKEVLDNSALTGIDLPALVATPELPATHMGADPSHGGLTTHKGVKENCAAPDCAPDAPAFVELDHVGAQLYAAHILLGEQIKDLKAKQDRVREQLEARIGDAPEARIAGQPVISWKWSQPGKGFNAKQLAKDHPDIHAKYVTTNKAARPFKLLGQD